MRYLAARQSSLSFIGNSRAPHSFVSIFLFGHRHTGRPWRHGAGQCREYPASVRQRRAALVGFALFPQVDRPAPHRRPRRPHQGHASCGPGRLPRRRGVDSRQPVCPGGSRRTHRGLSPPLLHQRNQLVAAPLLTFAEGVAFQLEEIVQHRLRAGVDVYLGLHARGNRQIARLGPEIGLGG